MESRCRCAKHDALLQHACLNPDMGSTRSHGACEGLGTRAQVHCTGAKAQVPARVLALGEYAPLSPHNCNAHKWVRCNAHRCLQVTGLNYQAKANTLGFAAGILTRDVCWQGNPSASAGTPGLPSLQSHSHSHRQGLIPTWTADPNADSASGSASDRGRVSVKSWLG